MRRALELWCLILGCLFAGIGAQADELTPTQMRNAAVVAIAQNQPADALQIANALLMRDGHDIAALILKARAARDLGDFEAAQPAASLAWTLSSTAAEKFASAQVMAQILSSQNKRTRAQLWLRRAIQHAPDSSARQVAIQEYRYVRARNRWKTNLNFSLTPNSNINNGSAKDTTQILNFFTQDYVTADLSGAAVALSGLEANAGAALRYRLSESPTHQTDLLVQGDMRRYKLSDKARRLAPDARASDFALESLNLGIAHRWRDQTAPVEYQSGLLLGATRYGGEHYSDQARVYFGINRKLTSPTTIGFVLSGDRVRGPLAPHADSLTAGFSLMHRHRSGTVLGARLSFSRSVSERDVSDYQDMRLDLLAEPSWSILGADPELGISLRSRDYDSFELFSSSGRQDREVGVYMDLNFAQAEFYGFTPIVSFHASRTTSNIGLFEVDRYGVQLAIRSAF